MKIYARKSLPALLLFAIFSFNAIAQSDPTAPAEARIGHWKETPKNEQVFVSKEDSETNPQANDLAQSGSYAFVTTTTGSLTDMSSGTTQLLAGNVDDTASPLTNIGFDFYFMGVRYTQFSINDNGVLRFGATAQTGTPYQPLGQAAIPIITAYGADQRVHTSGAVRYKMTGAFPNRVLTIEWFNMQSNFNTGGTADLTYQVRLYETTGVIELVYGGMTMSSLGAADVNSNDPHIGFSSGNASGAIGTVTAPIAGAPAPTFNGATIDPIENLYNAAGAIPVLNSAANGSRRTFSFTPPTPTAPTGLNFTSITATSMTLNWTDSPDEDVYAIYNSTDGINYTFVSTLLENAVNWNVAGLAPNTNYFWRVNSVSEGAFNATPLAGTQATGMLGNISSTGAGGNWSDPATWVGGVVPTATDNVTIVTGATVTIDSSNAYSVTVQNGATLQFEATTARTLTVTDDVTISPGGTFQSALTGTQTGHVLSVGGDLTNNGTLDFSTNANTAGAEVRFVNAANNTFSGTGAVTDLRLLTIQKGAGTITLTSPTLEINLSNMSVQGVTLAATGFLNTATFNGILKISGTNSFTSNLFQTAGYTIPNTGGIWFNNPNFTVSGQNGSPTLSGLLRMTQGTFGIGTATGNSMGFSAGSNLLIEGGAIIATGRFGVAASANAVTYNQSGGTITTCAVGHASTTLACFDLGTGAGSLVTISGGTIIVRNASTAASGPRDYRHQAGLTGTTTVTGGTVQLGDFSTAPAPQAFNIAGVLPNLFVNSATANHTATFLAPAVFNNITRSVTVSPGSTLNVGNNVFLFNGTTFTNNGTLTANGASTNFVIFTTGTAVTYTGAGTVTVPMTNLAIQADGGSFAIDPATSGINVNALRLFSGNIINANELTIGSGGATTATVQFGNTTTPTNAGTFDATPIFNPGTGGIIFSYLRTSGSRTTGPEIPASRTINNLTFDDNAAGRTLTLAGGNLTVAGTLTLTNGVIVPSAANTLIHNGATVTRTNGFVDGPLRREYPAATGTSYIFHVGEGVYSPVALANIAAVGNAELSVEAYNATLAPFGPATSISRNWGLNKTGAGTLTADVSFTYDQTDDVNGNEADYRLFRRDSGNSPTQEVCGTACVDETTNVATITGLSSFSRWTIAEAFAPTAAPVSLGGRVLTADGGWGIPNASVTISGGSLASITTRTTSFGFYSFQNLPPGTYVVSVTAKGRTFTSRVVSAQESIVGFDFLAEPDQP